MVIAIAPTVEERTRLAGALDGTSVVLLVSNPAEALEVLRGAVPDIAEQAVRRPVPAPGAVPAVPGQAAEQPAAPTRDPGLEVDSDWRVVRWDGREFGLTPLEHDLLVCLLERVGHIETFESIQRSVWGNDHLGGRSHVQSVVKRLRRKLEDLDSPVQIEAVRGVGLRLIDVRDAGPRSAAHVPAPRLAR